MAIMENSPFCTATGYPKIKMHFILGPSSFLKILILKKGSLPAAITATKIMVTITCASTVATAAPITPMAAMGPNPFISRGSKTILRANPIRLIIKGVLLLPAPLKTEVSTGLININTIPMEITPK